MTRTAAPRALYTDRHSVHRVNRPGREGEPTQFTRALLALDIEPIHARSAQAKGRVERVNLTLQDRLVKEMRLRGISDIEAANAFAGEYMGRYNAKYAVSPASAEDAHQEVLHDARGLDLVLSRQTTRRVSRNLSIQHGNRVYQLKTRTPRRLIGAAVTVCEAGDGTLTVLHAGRPLEHEVLVEHAEAPPVADGKGLDGAMRRAIGRQAGPRRRPPPDHPWNRMARQAAVLAEERAARDWAARSARRAKAVRRRFAATPQDRTGRLQETAGPDAAVALRGAPAGAATPTAYG